MEFRGIMGGFYRISEWIMRLSAINLMWILCSLPFFYLLIVPLLTPEFDLAYLPQFLIVDALIAPFTLFPATAAMFAVARKWVTGDEDVPLFKTFFRSFKENYVQSMIGGFVFALLAVLLYINYEFYGKQSGNLKLLAFVFLSFFLVLTGAFFNFFSFIAHFHMKIWHIVKNSLLFTIGHPLTTMMMLISNGFIVYISMTKFTFLIPFFMGSLIAVSSYWNFHRQFTKIREKQEKLKEQQQSAEMMGTVKDAPAPKVEPAVEPVQRTEVIEAERKEQPETKEAQPEEVEELYLDTNPKATNFHKRNWKDKE